MYAGSKLSTPNPKENIQIYAVSRSLNGIGSLNNNQWIWISFIQLTWVDLKLVLFREYMQPEKM